MIRRLLFPIGLVLSLCVLISLWVSVQVRQGVEDRAIARFAVEVDQVVLKIEERLAAFALVLRGAAAFFDGSDHVDRDEWRAYTEKLRISDAISGTQGIGFAQLLPADLLSTHIDEVRAEGFSEYQVFPPGERPFYAPVIYIEPFDDRNRRAFGYDILSDAARREALEIARDTGRAALSKKVELIQENGIDVQSGTLMFVPVYRKGEELSTESARRQAIIGWTYSPYRMDDLMQGMFRDWMSQSQHSHWVRIYDGREAGEENLLFNSADGLHQHPSLFVQTRIIEFNGRQWLLVFDHVKGDAGVNRLIAWIVFIALVMFSGLILALTISLMTTRVRAMDIAKQLTSEVKERERERERLLHRVQTISNRVPSMVFEYHLYPDGSSGLAYASEAIRHIFHLTPEAAVSDASSLLNMTHPDDRQDFLASINHSAKELVPWQHEYRICRGDGDIRWLSGYAAPHKEADGSIISYGVLSDITERKKAELALGKASQEANRFREALDYVSSCIYIKDSQSRYLFANRATLQLFGVTAAELVGSDDACFFPMEAVRRLRHSDARVLRGEQTTEEVELTDELGRRRVHLDIKTPVYDEHDPSHVVGLLGISTDISQIKEHEQELEHLTYYDVLTNLPNRALLTDRLSQAMVLSLRRERQLAVVYLDLDGFKEINDEFGHATGDELLKAVARSMQSVLREGDTLSRIGGDEFVAVLQDLPDNEGGEEMFQQLLMAAAVPVRVGSLSLHVSASLGVSFYPQSDTVEADQLLRQADQAMYQAKLAGKGCYHLFDAETDRHARSHHETLSRIRSALVNEELVLHYQPKVNMRTGLAIGVEALIRWQHPERGLLSPFSFLPVIEDDPLAIEVGEWVIEAALKQMARWLQNGLIMPVSVNIGGLQLRQGHLDERLAQLLGSYSEVRPEMLELEVLETSALGDLALVIQTLEDCRELGVMVSLDDFGTGYSSLTYLKRLPANVVKIDQSFIRDILSDPEDLAILSAVIGLAGAFNRQVVAEGVETIEHGDVLLRAGCDLAQGYGIARPMPAADVEGWLKDWAPPSHWRTLKPLSLKELGLLHVRVEHRAWINQFLHYLTVSARATPPEHVLQGGISRWLQELKGSEPIEYEKIKALHDRLQQQASMIIALMAAGKADDARLLVPVLVELSDLLVSEIDRSMG